VNRTIVGDATPQVAMDTATANIATMLRRGLSGLVRHRGNPLIRALRLFPGKGRRPFLI